MSLADHTHVTRRFQRSIRIDTDLHDPKALEGFVCPRSSAEVLSSMARHVAENRQGAFTWTGPYGTGKSSLVVALSAALNGNSKLRTEAAETIGKRVVKELWDSLPPKHRGWRILPVVGQRAAPAELIGEALVVNGYMRRSATRQWTDTNVIAALTEIASEQPGQHGGLILFIDEMGKLLEGAAQGAGDIYFFQQLAEAASRSKGRLLIIGILHQAFDEYAQRLARDVRDEWAKVQGRFVDLIINTVGDEQLELLAAAIHNEHEAKRATPVSQVVAKVVRQGRPSASEDLALTLSKSAPLHPVVSCLLGPISRRRFGQNQRSLFGFLNSAEPYGFQDFLRDADDRDLYRPDRLWEYLRTNLEPSILASPDGHRWSMAVEAVERCTALGAEVLHLQILKTIALLDLFRERSGLTASFELLASCVEGQPSDQKVKSALAQLQTWSFVIFRKHLDAYAIHAGSDFDIEQALSEAMASIREVNFRELKQLAGLQPVLAKRHYHATGALRWFDVDLVPLAEIPNRVKSSLPASGAIGQFLLVVPTANETVPVAEKICELAIKEASADVVVGLSAASWQVIQLAKEFLAISKVSDERPELTGDAVARREVHARIADIRGRLESDLQKMFDTAEWYRASHKKARYSYSGLNVLASEMADVRYDQAPRLPNELLNRQNPSANANAAQKGLLKLMALKEGEPRLGIEGYPAEGGLFESILLKANIYRLSPDGWRFCAPTSKKDPCGLLPAWNAATEFMEKTVESSVTMADLYAVWQKPPFGIKEGLLPVLGVAFILAHRDKLAFYREGVFQARFTDLEVDYLVTDPRSIQLRWMDLSRESRRILTGLAEVAREIDASSKLVLLQPIDVARALIGIYEDLKPWTKRTNRLSANALRVRVIFKKASDPNKFLFDDIPSLLEDVGVKAGQAQVEHVITSVRDGLLELTKAYDDMLDRLRQMMLTELEVPNRSRPALEELRSRAENVRQLSGDFRLDAFAVRLGQFTATDTDMEGIASLAVNKPSRDWVDSDLDQAGLEIADLAQRFIRSEAFARVKGRTDKRVAMAVFVGREGKPTPVAGEFAITDSDRAAVDKLILEVQETLANSDQQRRNIILAALAEMSARYLDENQKATSKRSKVGAL